MKYLDVWKCTHTHTYNMTIPGWIIRTAQEVLSNK